MKKNDTKILTSILPANHPKKELANKNAKFNCKILSVKKSIKSVLDDNFAKTMGAKNLLDLKNLIEKQISSQYSQALNSITKKEILDLIEKIPILFPRNLIIKINLITKNLKKEEMKSIKVPTKNRKIKN